MGFNFTAFAGGVASAITEDIEKQEKLAEARGIAGTKLMYDNYKTVVEENRKLTNETAGNIKLLKAYDPTASEDALFAVSTNKPVMDAIAKRVAEKDFDPASFKLDNFAKVATSNVTATALERVNALFTIPKIAKATYEDKPTPTGNLLKDFIASAGTGVGERAARETANALGVSMEDLQAAKNYVRPSTRADAVFDMALLKPNKDFKDLENDAKVASVAAAKSGDPTKMAVADAQLKLINDTNSKLSDDQKNWANKVAKIKSDFTNATTPVAKAAAQKELNKLLALEQQEAQAKKVKGDDSEGKIPKLGTLNTHVAGSVAIALSAKYGQQIKEGKLAITQATDGTLSIQPMMTDAKLRKDILSDAELAAKASLSLYTDTNGRPLTTDVAAAMNKYTFATQMGGEAPAAPAQPMKPALPAPAAAAAPAAGAAPVKGAWGKVTRE